MALPDYTFEMEGARWGINEAVAVDADGFDAGTDEVSGEAIPLLGYDAVAFGREEITPATWSWEVTDIESDRAEEAIENFTALGRAYLTARRLRKVVALRYGLAGRTRVVFGRPSNWAMTMSNALLIGAQAGSFEFRRADTLFYDDEERVREIGLVPAGLPGLITPLITPLTTAQGGAYNGTIDDVGGDVPAPLTVRFVGPISKARLAGDGWEIGLEANVPAGMHVDVSTQPWERRAVRSDGAKVGLTIQTRLSNARLSHLGETLRLTGVDSTGTARCQLRWRAAHLTI